MIFSQPPPTAEKKPLSATKEEQIRKKSKYRRTFIISFLLSGIILWMVYSNIAWYKLFTTLANINVFWFTGYLFLFCPILLLTAWRWHKLASPIYSTSFFNNFIITMAAQSFNMLVPSKLGEFSKTYFLHDQLDAPLKLTIALTIFERVFDLVAISLILLLAVILDNSFAQLQKIIASGAVLFLVITSFLYIYLRRSLTLINKDSPSCNHQVIQKYRSLHNTLSDLLNNTNILESLGYSIAIWILHICHFLILFNSLDIKVSVLKIFSLVPVAIFAGLMPFTVAGLGTRDAALVLLFKNYAPSISLAGVGLLSVLRYIVPAIFGAFCLSLLHHRKKR